MDERKVVSLRERPELLEWFVEWFEECWGAALSGGIYRDCMEHCLDTDSPLPQWYLITEKNRILGGIGLICNDFNSRQDLTPWLCALYIHEERREEGLARTLVDHAVKAAGALGYPRAYLCTDHETFYEKLGFTYAGTAYHPWGDESRIYQIDTH